MKNILLATLLGLSAPGALANDSLAGNEPPTSSNALRTIPSLDVPRYMGTWYEIAKYPNWFQKKCIGGATAHYSLMSDGRVKVINRCHIAGGAMSEAIGVARQVGTSTSPKLEVRFAPAWLSFLPFVWGDYWVIELEDNYGLVAVSEPKREYLWILSRTPKVDPVSYNTLLSRLRQKEFDLHKLEVTQQD
ncbi:MAG: lipocalin family protein [Aromatoleum sp.]|jgi:apolipoprotein D and lipocalin family protein|uniref:lipocalin family protein n=1 Tax=Aromatoleum sp. TaxID=2307007 RepID=UPI00289395AE|nr:lipocalin family protein [Aromatoleum sp.]MDT3672074.1 lipocalin family protein [Aromatoleum sp.]